MGLSATKPTQKVFFLTIKEPHFDLPIQDDYYSGVIVICFFA